VWPSKSNSNDKWWHFPQPELVVDELTWRKGIDPPILFFLHPQIEKKRKRTRKVCMNLFRVQSFERTVLIALQMMKTRSMNTSSNPDKAAEGHSIK
jgi:hypothetical protein